MTDPRRTPVLAALTTLIIAVIAADGATLAVRRSAADVPTLSPPPATSAAPTPTASPTPTPSPNPARYTALNAALATVDLTRERLVRDVEAVRAGASAVGSVDAIAVTGDPSPLAPHWTYVVDATNSATATLRHFAADLLAGRRAVTALHSPARRLPSDARRSLDAVIAAARAEEEAMTAYLQVARLVWPRYADVAGRQRVWYARATAGAYPSQAAAASAYEDLLAGVRTSLGNAQSTLSRYDAAVRAAVTATDSALAALHRALGAPDAP